MKRTLLPFSLLLVALVAATPLTTRAEETADMDAWAAAMTPGEPHGDLAAQAGEWRYVVTLWSGPKAEPTSLEGVSLKTLIMGGRYLKEELTGAFMGRPFQGLGFNGYDNVTKQYVAIWLDNMGTGIHYYTGQEKEEGVQAFTSTSHDPATGRAIATRSIGRVIDLDHHTYESFVTLPDGSEFLQMQVEYTRAGH